MCRIVPDVDIVQEPSCCSSRGSDVKAIARRVSCPKRCARVNVRKFGGKPCTSSDRDIPQVMPVDGAQYSKCDRMYWHASED